MNDIIIPIAIANLLTEQKIGRDLVNTFFDYTNYINWSKSKKFFHNLITCLPCSTVWITLIFLLLKQEPDLLQYIYIPLTNMLISDIIIKIKK